MPILAEGKYGCHQVQVYPAECGEQLGRDPSKIGSSKSLVLKSFSGEGNALGLVPSSHPHSLGYACTLYAPHFPFPNHRGPKKSQRFPRQEKAMLHCDLRVRWKVASDLRFRAAISEPNTPSFCRISGDLACVNAEIAGDCDCAILVR